MIRVLQSNLSRCKAAIDFHEKVIIENIINLIVISELNKKRVEEVLWSVDSNKDIMIRTSGRDVAIKEQNSRKGYLD